MRVDRRELCGAVQAALGRAGLWPGQARGLRCGMRRARRWRNVRRLFGRPLRSAAVCRQFAGALRQRLGNVRCQDLGGKIVQRHFLAVGRIEWWRLRTRCVARECGLRGTRRSVDRLVVLADRRHGRDQTHVVIARYERFRVGIVILHDRGDCVGLEFGFDRAETQAKYQFVVLPVGDLVSVQVFEVPQARGELAKRLDRGAEVDDKWPARLDLGLRFRVRFCE